MTATQLKRLKIMMLDGKTFGVEVLSQTHDEWTYTVELVKGFPERKWNTSMGLWKVPTTPFNIRYLRTTFRDEELVVDKSAGIVLEYTELTEATASLREKRRWQYVFNGEVPEYEWACKTRTPFKHQIVAADAAYNSEFFAHLMEQGTGKTFTTIEEIVKYAYERKQSGGAPYRVCVLAPATLCRMWVDELEKCIPKDLKAWILKTRSREGGVEDLVYGMRAEADLKVWVLNYERVRSIHDALMAMEFDMIVADEASAIKNPTAKRTKAAIALAETCDKRRILTGTIMANSIFDVYGPFEFLSRGALGYQSFEQFKQRYGEFARYKEWDKLVGHKNLDELKERMARFSFIVRKKDCLDLPEKSFVTRTIEMGDKQRDLYEQMAESFCASLDDSSMDNAMEARAVIAQLIRFAQITSGYLVTPNGTVRIPDGSGKADAAMEIIREATGKTIVWCRFKEDIRYLAETLDKEGIRYVEIHGGVSESKRTANVKAFGEGPNNKDPRNDDDVRVLIGEPATGGLGLTLLGTENQPCTTTIFYSQDWSLLKRLQAEDRNHRIGQRFACTYYTLLCENSIDEGINDAIHAKRDLADELKNVASIRDLLLHGRRPKPAPQKNTDPLHVRELLAEQKIVIPMEPDSQTRCKNFDHDEATPRCRWCSGDPLLVPEKVLMDWWRGGKNGITSDSEVA